MVPARSGSSSSTWTQALGSPWKASGVTPKKQTSPAKRIESSTRTMRSPAVWPAAGISSILVPIGAPSVTSWVTGRVPSSARSSNSSAKAGMNAL